MMNLSIFQVLAANGKALCKRGLLLGFSGSVVGATG
jgi:hypothetical protein